MRMSFDDEESFQEAVESLRFNSSDPNTRQQMGSSNSMPLNDSEWNEDRDNITQVIQLHPDEWEAWAAVVYVYKKFGGVGMLKLLFIITHWQAIPNLNSLIERYRREIKILRDIDFLAIITNTTY